MVRCLRVRGIVRCHFASIRRRQQCVQPVHLLFVEKWEIFCSARDGGRILAYENAIGSCKVRVRGRTRILKAAFDFGTSAFGTPATG